MDMEADHDDDDDDDDDDDLHHHLSSSAVIQNLPATCHFRCSPPSVCSTLQTFLTSLLLPHP